LGDIAPLTTASVTVNSGTISLLTQPSGAVNKTFTSSLFAAATTMVIDSDRSLGAVPVSPTTNLTYTATGTLAVQPGTATVTLSANRNVSLGNITAVVSVSGGAVVGNSNLIIPGVISGGGAAALLQKTGLGALTLRGTNTAVLTVANGIQVIGGSLVLDY